MAIVSKAVASFLKIVDSELANGELHVMLEDERLHEEALKAIIKPVVDDENNNTALNHLISWFENNKNFAEACQKIKLKPREIFVVKHEPDGRAIHVTEKCNRMLRDVNRNLEHALLPSAKMREPQWNWSSLGTRKFNVSFKLSNQCWGRWNHNVDFPDERFKDRNFVENEYLKFHFNQRLQANKTDQPCSLSIAWFGPPKEDDTEVVEHWYKDADGNKRPKVILFNTGLLSTTLSSSSTQADVLLLCVPKNDYCSHVEDSPSWIGFAFVLSTNLAVQHVMNHLINNAVFGSGDKHANVEWVNTVVLTKRVDNKTKVKSPAALRPGGLLREKEFRFDGEAEVHAGNCVAHILNDPKRCKRLGRFVNLGEDGLQACLDRAVNDCRSWPGNALPQYFSDKKSECGEIQMILPLSLDDSKTVHAGLVLKPERHEDDDGTERVTYSMLTVLPLSMVLHNTTVMLPMARHWLNCDVVEKARGALAIEDHGKGQSSSSSSE